MAGLVALDGGDGAGTELAVGGEPLALGVELLLHQPDAAARAAAPQHDAGVGDDEAFSALAPNFPSTVRAACQVQLSRMPLSQVCTRATSGPELPRWMSE